MKKLSTILIVMILLVAAACDIGSDFPNVPQVAYERMLYKVFDGVRVFEDDFIEKYYETLNVMFDNDWTIVSVEERFDENDGYICDCGFDGRSQRFTAWTIEYADGNGDVKHFVLTNRAMLSEQVESYLSHSIAEYFEENFINVYMIDMPRVRSSSVSAFMAQANIDGLLMRGADEFHRLLGTHEGAIRLSQLTPANTFELVPIKLSISVGLTGNYSFVQEIEGHAIGNIENMIMNMNEFTNNTLNVEVSIFNAGDFRRRLVYNHGERLDLGVG